MPLIWLMCGPTGAVPLASASMVSPSGRKVAVEEWYIAILE